MICARCGTNTAPIGAPHGEYPGQMVGPGMKMVPCDVCRHCMFEEIRRRSREGKNGLGKMKRTIWKVNPSINTNHAQSVAFPEGSRLLHAGNQDELLTIWASVPDVEPEPEPRDYKLKCVRTGEPFEDEGWRYLGTCLFHGGAYVLHVYAEDEARKKALEEKLRAEREAEERLVREAREAEERRLAEERRKLEEERAAQRAEQERLEAERAALEAEKAKAKAERDAAEAAAKAKREAEERRMAEEARLKHEAEEKRIAAERAALEAEKRAV